MYVIVSQDLREKEIYLGLTTGDCGLVDDPVWGGSIVEEL